MTIVEQQPSNMNQRRASLEGCFGLLTGKAAEFSAAWHFREIAAIRAALRRALRCSGYALTA